MGEKSVQKKSVGCEKKTEPEITVPIEGDCPYEIAEQIDAGRIYQEG